ncbi:MAG: protein kinase [Bacteroidales bacterium]|nr:protein kinase [Bacteroidales bacterium]
MASINDEYEKLMLIGQGSFASIWKVRHRKYGYIRTLKILNTPVQDENDHAYQQFVKECTVLLNIGNGANYNIVHIYQPRLIDNRAVVEMDFIDGETLDQYLRRNKFMPIDEVMRFIGDIGGALAYCHHDIYKYMMNPNEDDLKSDPDDGRRYIIDEATEQRLVRKYSVTHNDLHSNNVMRRENDGSYVLLDFGLAIQNGTAVKSSAMRGGALEYMAPEKFDDNNVITTQSDIYSFGILMYEALAGRVPFEIDKKRLSSNPVMAQYEIMQQHKTGIPPEIEPLRREAFEAANPGQEYVKDFPDWLEQMIMRCLEKDPARRYTDAKELMNEFYSNRRVFVDENSLSERVNTQLDNNNYDVFISFSTQDSVIVDKICNYLEKTGLRCFVCTRDIPKSVVWAEAITEAIENCKMFLAVFSKHFDDSKQTDRELELASEAALPIICCRITNDEMTGATKYYLKNINWIDAYTDTEAGFCKILAEIQRINGENFVKDKPQPTDFSLVSCPGCGKMISKEASFCQYCGSHLHSSDGNKQVKCNGCGNLISSDDKECPYCGYPDCTQESKQGVRKTPDSTQSVSGKKKSKKWVVWLVLGIVLTVLAIIGVGIALLDNNVPEEWTETEEASDTLEFVDLGLPSGTKWSNINQTNPNDSYDFYTYDEAVQQFGDQLPTKAQFEELKEKCVIVWDESARGARGCRFYGPNNNSIFIPYAGYRDCNGGVNGVGSSGNYWSSTPGVSELAWNLYFYSGEVYVNGNSRCCGQSVRLVQD